jgi:hypothetical protein
LSSDKRKQVSLEWLWNSEDEKAIKFCASVQEGLDALEDEGYDPCIVCTNFLDNFLSRLTESDLYHFQQIADSKQIPVNIIAVKGNIKEPFIFR